MRQTCSCQLFLLSIVVTMLVSNRCVGAAPSLTSAPQNEVTPQQQRVWSNGCGYCHPTPNSIMSQSPDSNCTKYI
ncbi:hypothetical protein EB796_015000 [Bugula neritina]|uniref:Uncharacterized protein n=1 Tax=Bugula neritina TaxID=10212 RepID=A0A7J7JK57_BUGNE|nr:hypothetical protein EB796_015000 [Bugula neritina]